MDIATAPKSVEIVLDRYGTVRHEKVTLVRTDGQWIIVSTQTRTYIYSSDKVVQVQIERP